MAFDLDVAVVGGCGHVGLPLSTALYTVGVDDESVEAIRVAGESVRQAMWRGIGVSTAATDFVSPDH